MSRDRLADLSDRDLRTMAEALAELKAVTFDDAAIAAFNERARRRHAAATALGVKCPKYPPCSICNAQRDSEKSAR